MAHAARPASDEATNYLMDAGHTNARTGDTLARPLERRWSRTLGGRVTSPLIAGDRVFAVADAMTTTVYALDRVTGATLWSRVVGSERAGIAYENGRLFVLDDSSNQLRALDALDGETLWTRAISEQHSLREAPTVSDGVVYLGGSGSAGTVLAIAAATGATVWTTGIFGGAGDSSPAVDANHVYTTSGCAETDALSRTSGAKVWRYRLGCTGGGGVTPVVTGGRLYVQEYGGHVLNAATGTALDGFSASRPPAVGNGVAVYVLSGVGLSAEPAGGGATLWTFAGDGQIAEAPAIEGDRVFALSRSGMLYVLDRATGALLSSQNIGSAAPTGWDDAASPVVGQGTLALPAGGNLVAYSAAGLDTGIEGRPPAPTKADQFTLGLRSSDPAATFECSLDGGEWQACAANHEVSGFPVGDHWLEVRAVAGQERDPSPALVRWTRLGGLTTTVTSRPPALTTSRSAEVAFSAASPATFECNLDGAGWESCSSTWSISGLSDGEHVLQIRAMDDDDVAGPTERVEWSVDTSVPHTSFTTAPPVLAAVSSASFTLASSRNPSSYECRLDNDAWEPCASQVTLANLADGTHAFEARATSPVGIVDPTPARYEWSVDTDPPGVSFTLIPPRISTSRDATFAVAADEFDAQTECSLDGSEWTSCSSLSPASGLADGTHRVRARARDAAGNVTTAPVEVSFVIDGTPPETLLSPRQAGPTRSGHASFELSSTESDVVFECRLDGGEWASCQATHTVIGLREGSRLIEVRAIDAAGNVDSSPATWSWRVDRIAPSTWIESGPPATTQDRTAVLRFGSDEAAVHFECSTDGAAWADCTPETSLEGLQPGMHELAVRAVDLAGNVDPDPARATWEVRPVPEADLAVPRRYLAVRAARRGLPVTVRVPLHRSDVRLTVHWLRKGGKAARLIGRRVLAAAPDGDNSVRLRIGRTFRSGDQPQRVRVTATITDPTGLRTEIARVVRLR